MLTSAALLDTFRRDRARGANDDVDLTLRPAYRDLLAKLGDPHKNLPPVFHVAGTNGKGSTVAFLRAMLEAAGYKVHVYTSPHLVTFHERIRVAGELITEDALVTLLQECKGNTASGKITFFEAATAVAFTAFARTQADFTLVEVGLGGRLDATNVIEKPLASLITRLSYDHRDYLGPTMRDIAREKAGIMKAGTPCFAAAQPDEDALPVLRETASALPAPLSVAGQDWRVEKNAAGFSYRDQNHQLDLPPPGLIGDHQYDNAGLAIAALQGVRKLPIGAITAGLRNVSWPARLQAINNGKLAALLPRQTELWLDGGHNDSAGAALARQAAVWKIQDQRPLHLICGMLANKNPAEFLQPLAPYTASLQAVPIPNEAGTLTGDALAAFACQAGIKFVSSAASVEMALENFPPRAGQPIRVLICGSLYLAGDVLRQNVG